MKRFTFDTIHRDSFPRQFQVRYANDTDKEGDTFENLTDVKKALKNVLRMDIFICSAIVADLTWFPF